MAEPLKVILIVSAICSGIYALVFFKNVITTGQINIEYILQIFVSFLVIASLGLFIWGMVYLAQAAARKTRSNRPKGRHL
jgi:hypothetical protein